MTRQLALVAFAGLAFGASAVQAQVNSFILNDGLFRYSMDTTNGGAAARTGVGGGISSNFGLIGGNTSAGSANVDADYLYQNWFWYRTAGDNREYALSNMTFSVGIGGSSIYTRYVEPIAGGVGPNEALTFDLTYTLNQISATQAAVTINWSITNNAFSTQTVSFFSYADSDVPPSLSNNSSSYVATTGLNYYRNDETAAANGGFFTMGADLNLNNLWQIGPWLSAGSPRADLTNGVVNDLTNTNNTPLGDNAGALQWQNLVLAPGGNVGGRITLGYNYVVPAPGAAALLGLGALAMGRRRR
jgi:hypothetical protein